MTSHRTKRRFAAALLLAVMLLGLVPAVFAQGCAMCRTEAEATGPGGAKALNLAIFVLLIPTLAIFCGVVLWAVRFRDRARAEEDPAATEPFFALLRPQIEAQGRVKLAERSAFSSLPR